MESLVPNVTGMGLRDAMYILENHGLQVRFSGRGKVVEQTPKYGRRFKRGDVITIRLG
ncbi:MAG: PASTA domain-containing protein [Chitinophagales bacterium]